MSRLMAAVICIASGLGDEVPACGKVDLTEEEYEHQLARPNQGWFCPRCGGIAQYDDARSEELQGIADEEDVPR